MFKKNTTPQSRETNNKIRLSARVEASATELAARADQQIRARLGPILQQVAAMPDLAVFQRLLAEWLSHHREHLADVETLYDRELRIDSRLRQRRDRLKEEVVMRLRRAQMQIDSLYGPGWSSDVIGIGTGLSSMDAARLVRVARQAIVELRRPDLAWLEPLPADTLGAVDFEIVARSIETPLLELQEVLTELPASLKRTQGALEAKHAQIKILEKEIQRVAAVLQGIYRFAELEFHAERLRPKSRSSEAAEAGETPELLPLEAEAQPAGNAANDDLPRHQPAAAS